MLAQKLAREALFGEDVLRRCTPQGNGPLPALLTAEMQALKKVMFQQFPQYWQSQGKFKALSVEEVCRFYSAKF
mgnify:FL=1